MTVKWCCDVQWMVETPTVSSICVTVECARRKYTVMLQQRNEGLFDVGTQEETNEYVLLLQ